MLTRTLADTTVSAIGLGTMGLSIQGRPDEDSAIRTIHAALDAGITLIDTADSYCLDSATESGYGERLVAKALSQWSGDGSSALVATKGGKRKPESGEWPTDGRPEHLREACDDSLKALGVEAIGLYQLHSPDPAVPFAESVGTLAELLSAGKILRAGISNVTVDQITEAMGIVPLASVQNQLSVGGDLASDVLSYCGMFDIAFLAYSPLGGLGNAGQLPSRMPALATVAAARGVSPQQVALAWLLEQSSVVIPIPSARRPETAIDAAAAADLELSVEEVERLAGG